jgi:hypothetical protein
MANFKVAKKQPQSGQLDDVFNALKAILSKYERSLVVQTKQSDQHYLNARQVDEKKRPIFFGSVQKRKGRVSFYLMPVYCAPELLDDVSPELKKRMQGKSCFNFKEVDKSLFKELAALTKSGFQQYKKDGLV